MGILLLLRGAVGAGKSATAGHIISLDKSVKVIEVDDIKNDKYGATTRCVPQTDFPEAGHRAKAALRSGHHAVIVEPLCEQEHVCLVLKAAGLDLSSDCIRSVWLSCKLETSLKRKSTTLAEDIVRQQHERYAARFIIPHELVIDTDAVTAEAVAKIVFEFAFSRLTPQSINEPQ